MTKRKKSAINGSLAVVALMALGTFFTAYANLRSDVDINRAGISHNLDTDKSTKKILAGMDEKLDTLLIRDAVKRSKEE
jgi:hypothetical protein